MTLLTKVPLFTPVLIAIRACFGVFQVSIVQEFSWLRAEFSLAIAAQRFGDPKAIALGAVSSL